MAVCAIRFKEKVYYLHKRLARNGNSYLYFFSEKREEAIELPENFEVVSNRRSGFSFVRKRRPPIA